MKTWTLVAIAMLFASPALAGNTPAPLTGGTIHIKFQADSTNPDALPTASIAVVRIDTSEVVYCEDVAPDGIAEGDTSVIANDAPQVLLEGVAWSDPSCAGIASLGSLDRYHVVFAIPGRPVMKPF